MQIAKICFFSGNDVCMVSVYNTNVSLARAGATAEYVEQKVVFCGGQNGQGVHQDCLHLRPHEGRVGRLT